MIDKEMLLNDLKMRLEESNACLKYKKDAYYEGACSALKKAIKVVKQQRDQFEWINADIVPVGYDYILLSLSNFENPVIGRYEEDEDGGAYYIGDETETCSSQGLIVNAWMPLPDPYVK